MGVACVTRGCGTGVAWIKQPARACLRICYIRTASAGRHGGAPLNYNAQPPRGRMDLIIGDIGLLFPAIQTWLLCLFSIHAWLDFISMGLSQYAIVIWMRLSFRFTTIPFHQTYLHITIVREYFKLIWPIDKKALLWLKFFLYLLLDFIPFPLTFVLIPLIHLKKIMYDTSWT